MLTKGKVDPKKRKQLSEWVTALFVNMTSKQIEEKTGVDSNSLNSAKGLKGRTLGLDKFNSTYNSIQQLYQEMELANSTESSTKSIEYLYYYYSSKYEIAIAKMCFNLTLSENEWGNGTLEYLEITNDSYQPKWKFSMERIWPKRVNKNARVAFYSAKCDDPPMDEQVNFFTINIKNSKIEKRKYLFLTYSVLETDDKKPSAGVGLLVEEKDIGEKLRKIFNEGIDSWIVNALRNKKHTLEGWISHVYSDINIINGNSTKNIKPKDVQSYCANSVSGLYKGYYLRSDIPSPEEEINDQGGVVCVIIQIQKNGEVLLYYKLTEGNVVKKYKGSVVFPNNDKKFLKISLELDNTHRFYMFLKQIDSDGFEYSGIFSGWKKTYSPFSTAMMIRKIRNHSLPDNKTLNNDDLKALLGSSFVGRIHKSKLERTRYSDPVDIQEVEKIIKIFSTSKQFLTAYNECIELMEKCLPNYSEVKN